MSATIPDGRWAAPGTNLEIFVVCGACIGIEAKELWYLQDARRRQLWH